MNHFVAHKRYTVILLVAFLMSTLIPVLKVYELQQFVPFGSAGVTAATNVESSIIAHADEGETKVLLCTSEGFKWVSLAELEGGSLPNSHSYFDCASCCLTAHDAKAALPLPSLFIIGEGHYASAPQYAAIVVVARTQIYARGVLVRGPPLTV